MRRAKSSRAALSSYFSVEDWIPASYLLRAMYALVNSVLAALSQTSPRSAYTRKPAQASM